MADDADQASEYAERLNAEALENRPKPDGISAVLCMDCGDPIPERLQDVCFMRGSAREEDGMTPTIRTTDNRARYGYYCWPTGPSGIVVKRWRPSLVWRIARWWKR